MEAILHKLCEKSQQELWDLLKENNWTKDHAEVAFYMVEILKGVKKIEHLKKVQEAMERAEEMGEEGMEHMLGKEQNMHHYARSGNSGGSRGGRTSGGRGSGGRSGGMSNYTMFDYDEGEGEGMNDYARRGRRMNYNYENYTYPDWSEAKPHYPPMYYGEPHMEKEKEKEKIVAEHFEKKYKEMLEDKWEKEKKEKEEKQSSASRLPPPPPK